jgi:restriction system protein
MAIPDYQSLMLPLLRFAADGAEHTLGSAVDALAEKLGLTEEEIQQPLPSGKQTYLQNRIGWAKTYLTKAGLLETPRRGRFRICELGMSVLAKQPKAIDNHFLQQFPEFNQFMNTAKSTDKDLSTDSSTPVSAEQTPKELLETSYQFMRTQLVEAVLDRVKVASPRFFEQLVVDLLVAMGYGGSRVDAGRAMGKSGDGGIDGIIKEDRLGLDVICLQAKRWQETVGRPVVQAFAGSLMGRGARKGVLITTSGYSKEAIAYADGLQNLSIVLIDGTQLAELMIDHSVGVAVEVTYIVKRMDLDYFEETV